MYIWNHLGDVNIKTPTIMFFYQIKLPQGRRRFCELSQLGLNSQKYGVAYSVSAITASVSKFMIIRYFDVLSC